MLTVKLGKSLPQKTQKNIYIAHEEGPAFMRLSRFRPSVRMYVHLFVRSLVSTLDFSIILHAQFTSDPQYSYRLRTPYVLTNRGADLRCP